MSLITVKDADLNRGRVRVLHDISLAVERGEIITIVGPNGSGKSSLLRMMIGEFRPDRGRVTPAAGLRIGYVPQRLHIDPTLPLTVRRFLDLPHKVADAAAQEALHEAGAEGVAQKQLVDLSGGQMQRVLLARAVLSEPDILLLDEPTQGLDQPGAAAFYLRIEAIRQRTDAAVVMVSHDLHVVMSASDRVICLNGHICCEGTPAHVTAAPEWRALFGTGTGGALALYRHAHDHAHDNGEHDHSHAQLDG